MIINFFFYFNFGLNFVSLDFGLTSHHPMQKRYDILLTPQVQSY
jgi:hypothetical protein